MRGTFFQGWLHTKRTIKNVISLFSIKTATGDAEVTDTGNEIKYE